MKQTPLNNTDIELDLVPGNSSVNFDTDIELDFEPVNGTTTETQNLEPPPDEDTPDPQPQLQSFSDLGIYSIEDAPDDFDLLSMIERFDDKGLKKREKYEKQYGFPTISMLKDEIWHALSVSASIFDNLPKSWEERKALHFQVNNDMVNVRFSDLTNYVTIELYQASTDKQFDDIVGFSKRDVNINTSFSSDNYLDIIKKPNKFHVALFDDLVPIETVRFDYDAQRREVFDDTVYKPFSKVYTNPLKEFLSIFAHLTSIKTSIRGRTVGSRLYFIDGKAYLIHEDSSVLAYPLEDNINFPNCCISSKFIKALSKLLDAHRNESVNINISEKRLQVVGNGFTISTSLFTVKNEIKQKTNEILDLISQAEYVPVKVPMLLDISHYTNAIQFTDRKIGMNYSADGRILCTPKVHVFFRYDNSFLVSKDGSDQHTTLDKPLIVSTYAIQRLLPAFKNAYTVDVLLCPPRFVLIRYVHCYIILCDAQHLVIPYGVLA